VGIGYFYNIFEVWFSIFYWKDKVFLKLSCFGRTRLSSYLVILYWLRGLVFVLRFEGLDKVIEKSYCLLCIDDSSMILLFLLHMFSLNNSSVNFFNDS
jgi:hypothetical protein